MVCSACRGHSEGKGVLLLLACDRRGGRRAVTEVGGWGRGGNQGTQGPRGQACSSVWRRDPGGLGLRPSWGPWEPPPFPQTPSFLTPWACAAWPAVKTLPPAFPGWGLPHRLGRGHPSQPHPTHHGACFLLSGPCGWRGCASFFGHRGADGQCPRSMAGPCWHCARSAKDKAISVEIGIARCSTFSLCQTVWL